MHTRMEWTLRVPFGHCYSRVRLLASQCDSEGIEARVESKQLKAFSIFTCCATCCAMRCAAVCWVVPCAALCHALLCGDVLCSAVVPCYALLCCALPCCAVPCCALLCHRSMYHSTGGTSPRFYMRPPPSRSGPKAPRWGGGGALEGGFREGR